MPPNTLFQKEEILTAALKLVREKGEKALTARALAAELGCSVKPIFGLFPEYGGGTHRSHSGDRRGL